MLLFVVVYCGWNERKLIKLGVMKRICFSKYARADK